MKKLHLFLFCTTLLFWLGLENFLHVHSLKNICLTTSSSPSKERLAKYFSDLFHRGGFGYTLIGARALAFDIPEHPTPFREKKQTIIFNSNKFLFKENRIASKFRVATFIHKENFITTFNENQDLFRKTLGEEITAKKLLREIETSEKHILDIIHNDEALLGILLGCGRENALLYARFDKLFSYKDNSLLPLPVIPCFHWHMPPKFSLELLTPSSGFASLKEEAAWFEKHFNSGSYKKDDFTPFDIIYPRGFKVKKSSETKRLIKKYTKCKEILTNLFYGRDVVDVVLEQLNTEKPLSLD